MRSVCVMLCFWPDSRTVHAGPRHTPSIAANFVILNLLVFFSRGYGHQLRYLAERLRRTVAQRTAELTRANAGLAEQARALEAKQEELRTFVYTVTHELKNPVNAALLTVDLVLERALAAHPQERFPTAGQFAGALDLALQAETATGDRV